VAVKLGIFPVPLAANPIAGLEFVHAKLAPTGLLTKAGMKTEVPAHCVIFVIAVAVGTGLPATVTVAEVAHKFTSVTLTVYVPGVNPVAVWVDCPLGLQE
jgi:hypothetical protein